MKYSIFIRSYVGDIEWLKLCLRSIHKFVKDWDEIVIVVPERDYDIFSSLNLTVEKLSRCPNYDNDYLGQQITKIFAFEYCKNDFILYVDSDCIFTAETTIDQFMRDSNPCILKTPYVELDDQAVLWKGVTERCILTTCLYEYMRRLPLLYKKSTLLNLVNWFNNHHELPIESYIKSRPANQFSEFNLIGAYADFYENENYAFLDTSCNSLPILNCKQWWSWSGLTSEERSKIEESLL